MRKTIKLDDIILDAGTQVRCAIHEPTVEDYAEAYKAGVKMPPVDLFADGNRYLPGDGFHRIHGARRAGMKSIEAEVHSGTRADCIKFALGTNVSHGLRRSNADKRNAVKVALAEFPKLSVQAIAEMCLVGWQLVNDIRKLQVHDHEPETRTGRDGKEYPAPPPPPPPAKEAASENKKVLSSDDSKQSSGPPAPAPKSAPAPVPKSAPPAPAPKPEKKSPPPAMLDKTGYPIPQKLEPLWNRGAEIQELLTAISKVRSRLKKAQDEQDPLFRGINFSRAQGELDQAYADIKTRLPYAVCLTCQGQATQHCTACGKTGIIGQFYYDTCVSQEVKDIRKRSCKQ